MGAVFNSSLSRHFAKLPSIPEGANANTLFNAHDRALIPGAFLAVTVLAVNLLGDGLRDRLDPRLARRL